MKNEKLDLLQYVGGTEPEEYEEPSFRHATNPRQSNPTPSRPMPAAKAGLNPSKSRSANRDNRPTGAGRKSSGARVRCGIEGCQAFESPAHSGFCSYHESQNLGVGERPEVLRYRACKGYCIECTGFCSPPAPGEDEHLYCDVCERQSNWDNEQEFKKAALKRKKKDPEDFVWKPSLPE
jgi:hypothetical protein